MPIRLFHNVIFIILLSCLGGYSNYAFSQSTPNLPAFYPIAEHSYDIKDGLPDLFVENVLLDKVGRLHINTAGPGATAFGESYYEYDGTRTYPAGLDIKTPASFGCGWKARTHRAACMGL